MSEKFVVHVVPGSKQRGVAGMHGRVPKLRVTAPPVDGRANKEAEKLLSEIVGCDVRLVAGARSRTKTFEADLPRKALDQKLRTLFDE